MAEKCLEIVVCICGGVGEVWCGCKPVVILFVALSGFVFMVSKIFLDI
jgi:hypothetical protein